MTQHYEIGFTDELLADGSVHRRFADEREEWRQRLGARLVRWRDNQGNSGTDEMLGDRIIKRTHDSGQVSYARDIGYGRTVWPNGSITRNRTSFGGRIGTVLAAVGAGALLGAVVAPPLAMSAAEEEELRQRAQSTSDGGSGGGGGDGGDGGGGDVTWGDDHDGHDGHGDDGGDGDDFG